MGVSKQGRNSTFNGLTSGVPGRQQINAAWKVPSFQATKDQPQRDKSRPFADEAEANDESSPEYADSWKEKARPGFTADNSHRSLNDDIGDEERKGDQAVSIPAQ